MLDILGKFLIVLVTACVLCMVVYILPAGLIGLICWDHDIYYQTATDIIYAVCVGPISCAVGIAITEKIDKAYLI
jgi:hypothetical protein